MARIKHDPNQTKVVVALLVVLVAAIGVTAARVKRTPTPSQPAPTCQQALAADTGDESPAVQYYGTRNPFERPPFMVASECAGDGTSDKGVMPLAAGAKAGPYALVEHVPPLDIRPAIRHAREDDTVPQKIDKEPAVKPSFTLLATIKGANGVSAIIKTDDSDVRIVQVGDTLKNGFKVKSLEDTRAILTDGRNTIIVQRPQS